MLKKVLLPAAAGVAAGMVAKYATTKAPDMIGKVREGVSGMRDQMPEMPEFLSGDDGNIESQWAERAERRREREREAARELPQPETLTERLNQRAARRKERVAQQP